MPTNLIHTFPSTGSRYIRFKRPIGYLSDGTIITALVEEASPDLIYLYYSTDRSTWNLIDSLDISSVSGLDVLGSSLVVDSSDNIHLVFTSFPGFITLPYYVKYSKGAGYTWTAGSIVDVLNEAGDVPNAADSPDLDVSDAGWAVIAYKAETSSTISLKVVHQTSTGWSTFTVASSNKDTNDAIDKGFATIMRDPRGPASGSQTFLVVGNDRINKPADGYFFRVRDTDGAISGQGFTSNTTSSPVIDTEVGILLPCNGDGAGDVNYWTWMLVYTTNNGSELRFRMYHLDQDGTLASEDDFEIAPVSWGRVGDSSFTLINAGATLANKGEAGDWITDGRVHTFRVGDVGSLRFRSLLFGDGINEWATEGEWPNRITNLVAKTNGNGAQRNVPDTAVDIVFHPEQSDKHYFATNEVVGDPSDVEPLAGSTVVTDLPTMKAVLGAGETSRWPVRGEWEVADDAGFTSNVKQILEPWSDTRIRTVSKVSEVVSEPDELNQGTKHVRARTHDTFGTKSAWTAGHSFSVSHPPTTSDHSPTGNTISQYGAGSVTLSWEFSDTSPVDFQTAYEVEVSRNSDGSIVDTSGKVVSSETEYAATISSSYKGETLRWRVRVYDSDDVVGPWSDYNLFELADAPVVEITYPAEGEEIDTAKPTITWTFTPSNGRPLLTYKVTIRDQFNVLVHQKIGFTATSYELPEPLLENEQTYTVRVEAADTANLIGSDLHTFTTMWVPPAHPADVVDHTTFDEGGYVNISWTNAAEDPEFVAYNVYRTNSETGEREQIYTTTDSTSSMEYNDWFVKSGTSYRYEVVQAADRFGSIVESESHGGIGVVPETTHYWLIHPSSPDLSEFNFKLAQVTNDSFTEEYEREVMNLIGRGRKVDIGDRFGFTGTLTCQVWDTTEETAHLHRLRLESLKALKTYVYLRNPFGDMWKVSTGDIDIDRAPGTGLREFHEATIPYEEIG